MSGFRKFRATLQRRRRSIEALEMMHWPSARQAEKGAAPVAGLPRSPSEGDRDASPLDFSPSLEAQQIGPAPIAWLRPRKPDLNH